MQLSGAPDEIIAQMPKQNLFGKIIRDQRKGNYPSAPKSLAKLELPDVLTTTISNFTKIERLVFKREQHK